MTRHQTTNRGMFFAKSATDLMQRLARLPTTPHLDLSAPWKAQTVSLASINTTFKKQLYTRWCCIDRLNRHGLPDNLAYLGLHMATVSAFSIKGRVKRENLSDDHWPTRSASLCSPAHGMLRDSERFLFFQIHVAVVTTRWASEAIKQGGFRNVSTMVLSETRGLAAFFWLFEGAYG